MNSSTISVLLPTFSGEKYLKEQLASLASQVGVRISLHALDDGSVDDTPTILSDFCKSSKQAVVKAVMYSDTPLRSASRSFLRLVKNAMIDPQAELFAFCDQDDIWLPHKLHSAISALTNHSAYLNGRPALYGGRTVLVDAQNQPIGLSPHFKNPATFQNALVQNIMGGNTMVFNRAAAALLAQIDDTVVIPVHDWTLYQLVSGVNGLVIYDPEPYVRYRQHITNVIGGNVGWMARWRRVQAVRYGYLKKNIDSNLILLRPFHEQLTPENQSTLQLFEAARVAKKSIQRLYLLRKSCVYRQSFLQNVSLFSACMVGRL